MSLKTHATIEDLYKVEGKAELVRGEIVHMPPAGDAPHAASVEVVVSLPTMTLRGEVWRIRSNCLMWWR